MKPFAPAKLLNLLFVVALWVAGAARGDAQCIQNATDKSQINGMNATCSACDVCIIAEVGTDNYYVRQGAKASNNLKVVNPNTALKAQDVAKLPGMAKFRPFRGGDAVQLSVSAHSLIFHGDDGGDTDHPVELCKDAQTCKSPSEWNIQKATKDGNTYTIQPAGRKNTFLCYNPSSGLSFGRARKPDNSDVCTFWFIVPSEIAADGEIKSYNFYPAEFKDHLLSANTGTGKVKVDPVSTHAGPGGAVSNSDKAGFPGWRIVSVKSQAPVSKESKSTQKSGQN